ncbi:unnamed protein product, partial [Clonostachys solani]
RNTTIKCLETTVRRLLRLKAQTVEVEEAPEGVVAAEAEAEIRTRAKRNRRQRRGGGQNSRGRGVASQAPRPSNGNRSFGGHLTGDPENGEDDTPAASLSGDAPEFVPGQPTERKRFAYNTFVDNETRPITNTVDRRPRPKAVKQQRPDVPKSTHPDIGVRIHEDIANYNYECVICTDEILRDSKIWTCSSCWTVFHLKCAKTWLQNEKKKAEARALEAPQTQPYTWRCPAYRCASSEEPRSYHCWCGKEVNPPPTSSALAPHSCGQTCTKPRGTCPHPCPLACHAGPCPPCDAMGPEQSCFCGKNASRKLCRETDYQNGWTCKEECGDLLPCGEHMCPKPCHPGLCGDCNVLVDARCYCGSVEKPLACYKLDEPQQSYSAAEGTWFEGTFSCNQQFERSYDCGQHKSSDPCRPLDELLPHCPFSTDVVSHCPCGKTPLEELIDQPRSSCEDPVPHCDKPCEKLLKCGHFCNAKCHLGDCPTCIQDIDVTCRCGRTTTTSLCHQGEVESPLCLKTCQAILSCGRHRCGEHCCPGEKKATERQAAKRKQRFAGPAHVEAEHLCTRICGRALKCGSHDCQQLCHRGACASCPEAIFEDISCACGRTVLQPPQPCGTRPPECRFPCRRETQCGHPPVAHSCHPNDTECPKCPYLTFKLCACGSEEVSNTPCHLQEVHCGSVCGKKLKCGKRCHKEGECEKEGAPGRTCDQQCAKPKLFCDHPCQNNCHGQTPCNESSPCASKVTLSCPCGQHTQQVKCLTSSSNPTPERPEIKCDDECLRQERNRRLAAALNIDTTTPLTNHIPYQDETLVLYRELGSWAEAQEREFRVFSQSTDEVRIRYKPSPQRQRQFLHLLAEDFGLEHQSEDTGSHRHVVVFKGPRFVSAPSKTIAQCVKIRDKEAAEAAATAAAAKAIATPTPPADPLNALVLTSPCFGLTIEDLREALSADLASHPGFHFNIDFLPSEEVLIRATAQYSAFLSPTAIEGTLRAVKASLSETIQRSKLAGNVLLCHVDGKNDITRREGPGRRNHDASGWSAVAGRAATGKESPRPAADEPAAAKGTGKRLMLGLRKKKADKAPERPWNALGGDVEC